MYSNQYARDGYYIAPQLLNGKECDQLKAEALTVMKAHAPARATVLVGAAVISPLFRQLTDHPAIVAVLRALMPDGVAFMSDKIVFKSGAQRFASPWHIDAFYWRGTRPKLSVWIALDDVAADNGALVVIRGSHLSDWQVAEVATAEFPNVIQEKTWAPVDEVICEVPRGSAIFFSDRLVHGSCENTAGKDRYSLISTYHAPAADEEFDKQFAARHTIR
jgi:ectoine hydroxylase-related dioxygenase (phytanoyl-CoA dioxygenase family)